MSLRPTCIISSSRILTYTPCPIQLNRKKLGNEAMKNLADKRFKGVISMPAVKKIGKIIDTWQSMLYLAKKHKFNYKNNKNKKMALITLTLSDKQKHDDNFIKRNMLGQFLQVLKRKNKLANYLWKAEYQKNGNIHFHIVVDVYVDWRKIKHAWNNIQMMYGYLDKYREEFGHFNANSTDIHRCKEVKNVKKYICKYLCKRGEERENAGRIWGCSEELKSIHPVEFLMTPELNNAFRYFETLKDTRIKETEYSVALYLDVMHHLEKYNKELYMLYVERLFEITFDISSR